MRHAQEFEQRRLDIEENMERAGRSSYKHGFTFKDSHGQFLRGGWEVFSQQRIASLTEKPAEPVLRRPAAAGGSSGW